MVVTAGLLAGLGAGCASSTTTSVGTNPAPAVSSSPLPRSDGSLANAIAGPAGESCPSTSTDPAIAKLRAGVEQVALPKDFQPVAAIRCQSEARTVPGDGEWDFADAQRADTGMAGLVAALRLPSKTAAAGEMVPCPAMAMMQLPFALVDAKGNLVSPLLPHDVCDFPLQQVSNTINALPWRTETDQRLRQIQTQAEIDTGCSSEYKDMFDHPVPGATPDPWNRSDTVNTTEVCVYTLKPSTPDDYIAIGSFTYGAKLTPAQQAAIVGQFSQAGQTPAPACTTKAAQFATVGKAGSLVELDGCKRIRWQNGFLSTAPDGLVRLLTTIGHG
jgi:hypothetical protein